MFLDTKKEGEVQQGPVHLLEQWQRGLLRAADLIERDGWCQRFANKNGRYCLFGAISMAAGVFDACALTDRVSRYLGVPSAISWNDAPCRTKEEAIRALRGCALEGRS